MAEGLMPGDLRACENPSRYTTDSDWALSELPNSYRIAKGCDLRSGPQPIHGTTGT